MSLIKSEFKNNIYTLTINRPKQLNAINENVLRGVYSHGFENPSSIQTQAIPMIIKGKDIIAQAQSGTGKTGSFSIGTLCRIDESKKTIKDYKAFGLKKFMGREHEGIHRISYLIDKNGTIEEVYEKVKTKTHALDVLANL